MATWDKSHGIQVEPGCPLLPGRSPELAEHKTLRPSLDAPDADPMLPSDALISPA
ncbi:hypothetical protein GCM10017600_89290 [Streptosporangium carneum]|uniref:Uncharacterized protein n=1 Tax=Streptosporangium carneum TaxID=47481 RepID=A0A9W6IBA6_9ACTN|nr:hypothetical protein GCM10017600_89290 [Streptosporangium carneum]